ncbi:7397_t:CDS:2 [Scutellospora calospora]|uniref:7397_t:CDS:1 n=1 Tax=Scutellospora calospora TaxID=85575 RepID=A0ACA9L2C6_9GLOM|nr:7397_t:CDS:2 [Scutellospora calospora]
MKDHQETSNEENKVVSAHDKSSKSQESILTYQQSSLQLQLQTLIHKTILPSQCKHNFYNIIHAQLRQITIYHISICFNKMKYEVIIPYEEISKIEPLNFGKLVLKFRHRFERKKKQIAIFQKFQQSPEVMIKQFGPKDGNCTQVTKQLNNIITTPSELTLTEVYVTCIFATEKRAIFYPVKGTFYHFRLYILKRFNNKRWNKTWFRNRRGCWGKLKDEDDWNLAKSESQCGKMERDLLYAFVAIQNIMFFFATFTY